MQELLSRLSMLKGPIDVIVDPETGPMELQEIGVWEMVEFDGRDRFAYAHGWNIPTLRQFIVDVAENLGIREGETEIIDKFSDKIFKSFVELNPFEENYFWLVFWYDARTGHLHRQAKLELLITPHSKFIPQKFDFYDYKKKVWITKIAKDLKPQNEFGIITEQLNEYIKENNMMWLLEEVLNTKYDLWDLVEDINDTIEKLKYT